MKNENCKCEKCGEKEATFHYSSNFNGEKTERRLCAECAREEGFGPVMDYSPADMFTTAFGSMFGGMFDEFFPRRSNMLSPFDFFGSPMRGIMAPALPRINIVIGQPEQAAQRSEPATEAERSIPDDAGAEVRARRELEALKHRLAEAVREERFEEAIELRDKIRELEK